ncbi:family 20 glycosylhydrolase [Aestuariivivens sediminicola]|uniref:family 20 glycosylhydrolase n=1 Tax=Aestuariivivens sediminicola TaxID=2913560 RepID=UPI001F59C93A|nr:family 20 glycosylhydrolase [Aestuariivivens sediminicola]
MQHKSPNCSLFFFLGVCMTFHLYSQDLESTFESHLSAEQLNNAPVKLIPFPQEVQWQKGTVHVTEVNIQSNTNLNPTTNALIETIFNPNSIKNKAKGFYLKFTPDEQMSAEGYALSVQEKGVEIRFKTEAGRFYGLQTLRQLTSTTHGETHIQLCEITDAPAHSVRGFMLDVGRNFIGLDILKEQLDIMARYKLNVFQWHLTDRPAWRIQNKKYPELTLAKNHRQTRNPGKYYTYNEIRELIAYAKDRHISVIPEIDMPGHSDSFTTAMGYPMSSEKGMIALENILNEFFSEIPKDMCPTIHLGSDEVEIDNPEVFMNKMIGICQDHERDVIVWNPGLKIDHDVIRQTWRPNNLENKGYREIDSWNSYLNNSEPMTAIPKLLFKPIGYGSKNTILGGILCLWPDVRLNAETDFIDQNPLYPALLAYSWSTWTGDIEKSSDRYLTMLPERGSSAFHYFKAFEDFLLYHKIRFFKNKPFPYVRQANREWLLYKSEDAFDGQLLEKKIMRRAPIDTTNWISAVGNTIIIKDRFKQGGYFPEAQVDDVVYAITTLHAEHEETVKAWIGFETPLRANRTYTGIAERGTWDANGGTIWLNGEELEAPNWEHPGWKPSKRDGWGSKEDQEVPWRKEELYWTREPIHIHLNKGSNRLVFRVPSTSDYQNWMFTFAPIERIKTYSNHYYQRKARFEGEPDTDNELIFLGNSITEGGNWKLLFPEHNVINRGISGDVTDGILNRIDEITSSRPSKVFLLIGTNDMARGKSVDDVLDGTRQIIEQIQKKSEHTKIYLQSILPIHPHVGQKFSGHKKNHDNILMANKALEELAQALHVEFIDLHSSMSNRKKYLKPKYTNDGLHLSENGYKKWKKIIRQYVN